LISSPHSAAVCTNLTPSWANVHFVPLNFSTFEGKWRLLQLSLHEQHQQIIHAGPCQVRLDIILRCEWIRRSSVCAIFHEKDRNICSSSHIKIVLNQSLHRRCIIFITWTMCALICKISTTAQWVIQWNIYILEIAKTQCLTIGLIRNSTIKFYVMQVCLEGCIAEIWLVSMKFLGSIRRCYNSSLSCFILALWKLAEVITHVSATKHKVPKTVS
jgi:hypothetical protein